MKNYKPLYSIKEINNQRSTSNLNTQASTEATNRSSKLSESNNEIIKSNEPKNYITYLLNNQQNQPNNIKENNPSYTKKYILDIINKDKKITLDEFLEKIPMNKSRIEYFQYLPPKLTSNYTIPVQKQQIYCIDPQIKFTSQTPANNINDIIYKQPYNYSQTQPKFVNYTQQQGYNYPQQQVVILSNHPQQSQGYNYQQWILQLHPHKPNNTIHPTQMKLLNNPITTFYWITI